MIAYIVHATFWHTTNKKNIVFKAFNYEWNGIQVLIPPQYHMLFTDMYI